MLICLCAHILTCLYYLMFKFSHVHILICLHAHMFNMLVCSYVHIFCMSRWSHAWVLTCLHIHMLPCSHAYTLIFSHYCMFTCLYTYLHIFGCSHAFIFTCSIVHMLIHPFDLHMIYCLSQVHMLARSYFTYLTAHMLPYSHDQLCICLYTILTFTWLIAFHMIYLLLSILFVHMTRKWILRLRCTCAFIYRY